MKKVCKWICCNIFHRNFSLTNSSITSGGFNFHCSLSKKDCAERKGAWNSLHITVMLEACKPRTGVLWALIIHAELKRHFMLALVPISHMCVQWKSILKDLVGFLHTMSLNWWQFIVTPAQIYHSPNTCEFHQSCSLRQEFKAKQAFWHPEKPKKALWLLPGIGCVEQCRVIMQWACGNTLYHSLCPQHLLLFDIHTAGGSKQALELQLPAWATCILFLLPRLQGQWQEQGIYKRA